MSPDIKQAKNQKAIKQLAPLDHASFQNTPKPQFVYQETGGSTLKIPSIEHLQMQNKLQPLNHIPVKKTVNNLAGGAGSKY